MNWLDEIALRLKRKNQVLFSTADTYLSGLADQLSRLSHRAVTLWALEFAGEIVSKLLEKYPDEPRPKAALLTSKQWAQGKVKMPVAQRAILQCHAVAKDLTSPCDIALCHAVGQACGTVHAPGHAMGLPIYELTAIVRHYGIERCQSAVEQRKAQYVMRAAYWESHIEAVVDEWADFMMK